MKILMIAGEASGDLHGAKLIQEIKRIRPESEFYGVGGEQMKAECNDILFDCRQLAVVGIFEVIAHIHTITGCFNKVKDFLKTKRPDLLILIDYPDFNLRLARVAKKQGIKVLYYISPQVWAWRKGRVQFISRWVDKMLVIFPFELKFYKDAQLDTDFVGHPLMDSVSPKMSQEYFKLNFGIQKGERIVALMPGSRRGEVSRILPVMLKGAEILTKEHPGSWRFIIALAPTIDQDMINPLIKKYEKKVSLSIVKGYTYETLRSAELAFVASGTATLEAAILGTPMILLYKLSWLTYFIARVMIKLPAIGLVNIVAGEEVVPELIQGDATGSKLVEKAIILLDDPIRRNIMLQGMAKVRKALGEPGATLRAAQAVVKFLENGNLDYHRAL